MSAKGKTYNIGDFRLRSGDRVGVAKPMVAPMMHEKRIESFIVKETGG
jgi:hypothetical protein